MTTTNNKQLIITEKPSVARDIVAALGGKKAFQNNEGFYESSDYVITWAIGHLLEFLSPEDINNNYRRWRLKDLPIFPDTFVLKPKNGQKGRLKILKKLINRKDVDTVINACDAGREGELIFREILGYIGSDKPAHRLWLQSMTKDAIRRGFEKLEPATRFDGLGCAAECRAESDWLIGMNATRALTKRLQTRKERTPWSVGRVQTPTLAMLVDREIEILSHQSTQYFRIKGTFSAGDHTYEGIWFDPAFKKSDDPEVREDWLETREKAEKVIEKIRGKSGTAQETRKPSEEKAPPPFDLTNLQRAANRQYGFSARRTLQIAQRLYEEYKLITYPRTDSRCLPADYEPEAMKSINFLAQTDQYGKAATLLQNNGLQNKKKIFNNAGVSDHFALMPTTTKPPKLPAQDARIYDLIVRRFLAAFYPAALWEKVERVTTVEGEQFKTRGKTLKKEGWHAVYERNVNGKERLPKLSGDKAPVGLDEAEVLEEETKPPPRITEAGLLNLMENADRKIEDEEVSEAMQGKGLGTPATRAEIIENLVGRNYVKRTGKTLAATTKGIRLIDLVRRIHITRLASPELTGEIERHLFEVERGIRSRGDFDREIRDYTQEIVERAKSFSFDELYTNDPPLGPCPMCKSRQIVEESLVYRCQGTTSGECSFVLWKEKMGRYLDRRTVETLLANGKTPPVAGFFTRSDQPYRAALSHLGGNQIQVIPMHEAQEEEEQMEVNPAPLGECPVCKQGNIIETPVSYICSRGQTEGCPFGLPRKLLGRIMTREEVIDYIAKGRTEFLDGFTSRRGRPFRGAVILGEHGRHTWEFPTNNNKSQKTPTDPGAIIDATPIGDCPVCKKGKVITAEAGFICREGEKDCPFLLSSTIAGREMTKDEAIQYIKDGKTPLLEGFISRRGKPFQAYLVLGKNGKQRWKFPPRNQR